MRALVGLTLCLVIGCKRDDRPFTTLATYDAPKSDLRFIVDATGVVPSAEDLSATTHSTVILCPLSTIAHSVRIDVPPWAPVRTATVTDGATSSAVAWDNASRAASLARVLRDAGYLPDAAEVAEALAAIDGVAYGPKGTMLAGQTRALVVANVDFSVHVPTTVASCGRHPI